MDGLVGDRWEIARHAPGEPHDSRPGAHSSALMRTVGGPVTASTDSAVPVVRTPAPYDASDADVLAALPGG